MEMDNIIMRVYLDNKRMFLSRPMIQMLGNPSHLNFWYDENGDNIIITPAIKDEIYSYEIPQHFWRSTRQSCQISRIAFLLALQQRLKWEVDSRYVFNGVMKESEGIPAAVFDLTNGTRLRTD
jgi:hypothetical protein